MSITNFIQYFFNPRFTNDDDKNWFFKKMDLVVEEEIGSEYLDILPEEPYFVNFMRDPPEPEDDDAEAILEMPLVYEKVTYYLSSYKFSIYSVLFIFHASVSRKN